MSKILKNESGVALLLVLGAIMTLTVIVVELTYNSRVSAALASSERDRLKAYYLARSGMQLVKLELKFEKDMRARFAGMLKNLPGGGVPADPLCKQIPLSTGLLKGIQSGALLGQQKEEGEGADSEEKPKEKPKEEAGEVPDIPTNAEEFLSFDGDFEVLCDTEERKLNLNIFRPALGAVGAVGEIGTETLTPYDRQKEFLYTLLVQKEFEDVFKGKTDEARKLVNAIADWADRDDRINEAPGVTGGSEDSLYTEAGHTYKVKNGRYASVAELLLVAGMTDDIYQKLAPQVTVYGDDKINLCQAEDVLVQAFVQKYIQTTPGIAPINPGDDEKWKLVIENVRFACTDPQPKPEMIAQAVASSIGAADSKTLASQLSTMNRFYRIEATSTVGESKMRLVSVIDTGNASPRAWKTLYFRVE